LVERTTKVAVALAAPALALAACGGTVSVAQDAAPAAAAATAAAGSIAVRGCQPQNGLIPTNTSETCGGMILDNVTRKLVRYNPTTGKAENDIAASITTSDALKFTVKLKPGVKFTDGTTVTASNFVKAWNFGAYGPNAQLNSYFFEAIKGFRAAALGNSKSMSGLKVVNPTTFTIELSEKSSTFRQRLGYLAFAPLPNSFFASGGPQKFALKPIGAGPYKVISTSSGSAVLEANSGYTGPATPAVKTVTFRFYRNASTAYSDLRAGKLAVTDEIPTTALAGGAYKTQLSGRHFARTVGVLQSITFPPTATDGSYRNAKLRKAVSMAINRKQVIANVFAGTRTPAQGWVSPAAWGYKASGCGSFCTYNPTAAKRLYREAGGHSGPITIAYNADGAHAAWVKAVCRSISNVLGAPCQPKAVSTFAEFRKRVTQRTMKGLFRSGWQMDWPSIENFLTPLYATGGTSNDGAYSNKTLDAKLRSAAAKVDPVTANTAYQEAERLLQANMPAIPLWHSLAIGGYSAKVASVRFTAFGTYDLSSIRLK
jgi:oligopeptide transport system substrate-binding protein